MKSSTLISAFLVLLIMTAAAWAESDQKLEKVRKAIKEKGAKWEAGETWVSRLSPEEKKKLLGDVPAQLPGTQTARPTSGTSLPDSFTWRDNNGYNWTTPVKNQSACGNCWAYASCGALEVVVRLTLNEPELHIDLSELYLTSCSGRGCELGWDQSSTLQFIKTHGVPDQSCFPGYLPPQPCADTCIEKYRRSIFIEEWYHDGFGFIVDPEDVETIKDRILNYGPVTVHFEVFEDFDYYNSGVYEHVWGDSRGWHAVSMMGWNDQDSGWICKNSWGTNWGQGGWFRIRMINAGVHIDEEAWHMTVDSASIPRITLTAPGGGENWLVGTTQSIKWLSPYLSGYLDIEYSTDNGSAWSSVTDSTFDDGSFTWIDIPDTPSPDCRVRIADAGDGNPWDMGDSSFCIIPLGDVNCDVNIGLTDVVYLINYAFKSGPEPCILEAGNVNCDWFTDTADIVFLINYLFKGGPRPEC
jgi:hypothetical protein